MLTRKFTLTWRLLQFHSSSSSQLPIKLRQSSACFSVFASFTSLLVQGCHLRVVVDEHGFRIQTNAWDARCVGYTLQGRLAVSLRDITLMRLRSSIWCVKSALCCLCRSSSLPAASA